MRERSSFCPTIPCSCSFYSDAPSFSSSRTNCGRSQMLTNSSSLTSADETNPSDLLKTENTAKLDLICVSQSNPTESCNDGWICATTVRSWRGWYTRCWRQICQPVIWTVSFSSFGKCLNTWLLPRSGQTDVWSWFSCRFLAVIFAFIDIDAGLG